MSIKKKYNSIVDGTLVVNDYTLPVTDGSAGQVMQTDGLGGVTFETPTGGSTIITIQSLAPTGTTQTIDWNNGQIVELDVTGATGNVTLTLQNPVNGDYIIEVTQGATPRDIIFPVGTIQGNGVSGNTVSGIANSIQVITVLYKGSYLINVNQFE